MMTHVKRSLIPDGPHANRVYSPDILPQLQSLLAALADIEVAHARRIEALKSSPMDDHRKAQLISDLRQSHRQQRARYVGELTALEKRMESACG